MNILNFTEQITAIDVLNESVYKQLKWSDARESSISKMASKLSNFIDLGSSWEAVSPAANRELLSILWKQKVHCGVHKNTPLNPILRQFSPIHTTPAYLSTIHFNIIHTPTSWSSFWLSHQYSICIPFLPHSCYMPRPSHPSWLDHLP
jgi:hypothetical protein